MSSLTVGTKPVKVDKSLDNSRRSDGICISLVKRFFSEDIATWAVISTRCTESPDNRVCPLLTY